MRVIREEPPQAETRVTQQAHESHAGSGTVDARGPEDYHMGHDGREAVVNPGQSSAYATVNSGSPRRDRAAAGPLGGQPHTAERTVRTVAMQYEYEATEGQPAVRWVARLTEFLRATTTTTSGLQGRVMEGLGLTATQALPNSASPHHQLSSRTQRKHGNNCSSRITFR